MPDTERPVNYPPWADSCLNDDTVLLVEKG